MPKPLPELKFKVACDCGREIHGELTHNELVDKLYCACGYVWIIRRPKKLRAYK